MRCIKCNRPIKTDSAAMVKSQHGPQAWGPVCAKRAGIFPAAPRVARHKATRDEPSENQLAIEFSAGPTVRQGHRYSMGGVPVIAMSSGDVVSVGEIDDLWFARVYHNVRADDLIAQPMKYFGGEIP